MAQQDAAGNSPAESRAVGAVTAENAAYVAALLELEYEAIQATSGPLRQQLSDIFRTLAGRYVLMFGNLDAPAADPVLAQQFQQLIVDQIQNLAGYDPTEVLTQYSNKALMSGLDYANRYLPDPVPDEAVQLPDSLTQAIDEIPQNIDNAVQAAVQFAEQQPFAGWDDVVRQMGKASQTATSVERSTTTAINRASNDAVRQVAVDKGANLLWVAEPDACVVCLALSGHLIDPMSGDGFDEEATFGRAGSAMDPWPPGQPLMGPPRHPNCRCHLELWFGSFTAPGGPADNSLYQRPGIGATVDLPAALRREAKRSIVRGWSLPSESGAVRIDAAARLLAHGAGLPRTVEERGHAAVKAGRFKDRTHPSRHTARRR